MSVLIRDAAILVCGELPSPIQVLIHIQIIDIPLWNRAYATDCYHLIESPIER